jgi:hypothetical protein
MRLRVRGIQLNGFSEVVDALRDARHPRLEEVVSPQDGLIGLEIDRLLATCTPYRCFLPRQVGALDWHVHAGVAAPVTTSIVLPFEAYT